MFGKVRDWNTFAGAKHTLAVVALVVAGTAMDGGYGNLYVVLATKRCY